MGGYNTCEGETRQVYIESLTWKAIALSQHDVDLARHHHERQKIGHLFTEVNTPGWVPEDHAMMTMEDLCDLFKDAPDGKKMVEKFKHLIMPADAQP